MLCDITISDYIKSGKCQVDWIELKPELRGS